MKRPLLIGLLVFASAGLVAARPSLESLQTQIDAHEIVIATTLGDTALFKGISAQCPAGMVVLGGGGRITFAQGSGSSGQAIVNSYPDTSTSWQATARTLVAPTGDWFLSAYAVCGGSAP
jgi:hypothetical protein